MCSFHVVSNSAIVAIVQSKLEQVSFKPHSLHLHCPLPTHLHTSVKIGELLSDFQLNSQKNSLAGCSDTWWHALFTTDLFILLGMDFSIT